MKGYHSTKVTPKAVKKGQLKDNGTEQAGVERARVERW